MKKNLELCQRSEDYYCTVGLGPCRSKEAFRGHLPDTCYDITKVLAPEKRKELIKVYFKQYEEIIESAPPGKIVAIGRCGFDFDRLHYADKTCQQEVFEAHFDLAEKYSLPMYFNLRRANKEFEELITKNRHRFSTGVVHSFTGTVAEM